MVDIPLHIREMSSPNLGGESNMKTRELEGDRKKDVVTNVAAKATKFSVPDFMTMSFEIVNISVGEPAVTIPVYKDLVCSVAPFFRGAFKYAFREAKEGAIALPDVEEPVFRIFLRWCFSQPQNLHAGEDRFTTDSLLSDEDEGSVGDESDNGVPKTTDRCFDEYSTTWPKHLQDLTEEERHEGYFGNPTWISNQTRIHLSLLKLYIFADKYSIDQLRDDVVSALIGHCQFSEWWPDDIELIQQAYDALPSTSPFLRLLVLFHCYCWSPPESAQDLIELEKLPHKFLLDVASAQSRRRKGPEEGETEETKAVPSKTEHGLANSCLFHEHLVLDKQECRGRMARWTYIFRDLLNMCIKHTEMEASDDMI